MDRTENRWRLAQAYRRDIETAWGDLHKRLDTITKRWDSFESDPTLFLQQPAIRDVSVPEVAAAIRALMDARARRRDKPAADVTDVADTAYYDAVAKFEAADAERQSAYRRPRKILDQLDIVMPTVTREAIEHQHLQQIEA